MICTKCRVDKPHTLEFFSATKVVDEVRIMWFTDPM